VMFTGTTTSWTKERLFPVIYKDQFCFLRPLMNTSLRGGGGTIISGTERNVTLDDSTSIFWEPVYKLACS
jgi:hypothetical protein